MNLKLRTKVLLGNCLFHCQDRLGYYRLNGAPHKPLAVLMYHGLETDPDRLAASSHRVTPEGCLKEIEFFQRQGYQLVSAGELDSLNEREREKQAGYFLVTFDDGHANIFPHVKAWMEVKKIPLLLGICPGILEENGIYWWEEVRARFHWMRQPSIQITTLDGKAQAFPKSAVQEFEEACRAGSHQELQSRLDQLREQTGYIDPQRLRNSVHVHENMNWQQIVELSQNPLCTIASHSMRHEIAIRVPLDDLRRLTHQSLDLLESRTGVRSQHYVYPNGMLSEETDQVLAGLGIRHTYSTKGILNRIPPATRLNRLTGYDLMNRGLRHYGALWQERHSHY